MNQIAAPFTVTLCVAGKTWSEPYFNIDRARRAVKVWAGEADFFGATIRNHKGEAVA